VDADFMATWTVAPALADMTAVAEARSDAAQAAESLMQLLAEF
jgi:hypothetical protein